MLLLLLLFSFGDTVIPTKHYIPFPTNLSVNVSFLNLYDVQCPHPHCILGASSLLAALNCKNQNHLNFPELGPKENGNKGRQISISYLD